MNSLWSCFLILAAATSSPAATNDLLAFFPLRTDGKDATGKNSPVQLTNAPFINGALYLDGVYEPYKIAGSYYDPGALRGYHATALVPALDYENLTISLDFFPLNAKEPRPLRGFENKLNSWTRGYYLRFLGQRGRVKSNILTGGTWYRWLGFDVRTNVLEITLNNQTFSHQFKSAIVRPGQWYNLICSIDLRRKQIVTILDGRLLETIDLPENFRLEILGKDREAGDKELTFVNYSNGNVFYGYAAHLRVFSRALVTSEMTNVYSALALERKSLPTLAGTGTRFMWLLLLVILAAISVCLHKSRKRKAEAQ